MIYTVIKDKKTDKPFHDLSVKDEIVYQNILQSVVGEDRWSELQTIKAD